MLALAIWLLRTQDIYEPLRIWRRMEPPHWPTIAGFARLGIPAGLAVMVEVTSFTLMALFIARQGTTASAAHQIAANVAAVLYMVPLSLAIATSARVSYWLGAGDPARARKVVFIGFRLSALIGIALAAILLIAKNHIGGLYSTNTGVLALTGGVIVWVAAYHAADAVQTLCVFVLRCYRITVAPLVVYCVLLWGAGLGGGYLLAYKRGGAVAHCRAVPGHAVACGQTGSENPRNRFAGKVTENTEPLPRVLAMSSVAPCRCSTCLTMASPRPVPPVSRERLRSTR